MQDRAFLWLLCASIQQHHQKPANSVMVKRREWNRPDELLHYAAQKVSVVKSLPKYLII
jgi:hypothetical protein